MLTACLTPEQRDLIIDCLVTPALAANEVYEKAPTEITRGAARARYMRLVSAIKTLEDANRHVAPLEHGLKAALIAAQSALHRVSVLHPRNTPLVEVQGARAPHSNRSPPACKVPPQRRRRRTTA